MDFNYFNNPVLAALPMNGDCSIQLKNTQELDWTLKNVNLVVEPADQTCLLVWVETPHIRAGKLFVMDLLKKWICMCPNLFTEKMPYVGSSYYLVLCDLSGWEQPMQSRVFVLFLWLCCDSWRLELSERLASEFRQCCLADASFVEEDHICVCVFDII